MTDGDRLARHPSSPNIRSDIELALSPSHLERLENDHLTGFPTKKLFYPSFINGKLPLSGFHPNPCDGGLSFACGVNRFCHGLSSPLDLEWNRSLGLMAMIRSGKDLQFGKHLSA